MSRFCPSRTVTRAQMAAFLYRAAWWLNEESSETSFSKFSYVGADAWYLTDAQWAMANGVMRASGGRFDPAGPVTRADMAEMLAVASPSGTGPRASPFPPGSRACSPTQPASQTPPSGL